MARSTAEVHALKDLNVHRFCILATLVRILCRSTLAIFQLTLHCTNAALIVLFWIANRKRSERATFLSHSRRDRSASSAAFLDSVTASIQSMNLDSRVFSVQRSSWRLTLTSISRS